MFPLITWLRDRPILNIILAAIFYLLVTLPHEQVGIFIASIFKGMPRPKYDLIILCLSTVIFIFYVIPLLRNIFRNRDRNLILFFLMVTVALTILSINTILIVNIELIHFIQYAVLAVLFFPLTLRYTDTLFWVTFLSAIDEAYQYWFISPERTNYYDFNDVIINMLGVVFGLLTIRASQKVHALAKDYKRPLLKNSMVIGTIAMVIITAILFATNIMDLYPNPADPQAPMLLIKKVETTFWSVIHPNITYHIVRPFEGLVILVMLFIFYLPLWRKKSSDQYDIA